MKAEQGYMIEAKKAMFQVQAERSVAFFTKNGNVTCVAQNENINLDAKRNVLIDAKTEDFRVKTGHDAYLEAKEAMGFVCKAGNWTAKDDLTLHGGKLTLTGKGKATIDGSKIHIG